MSKKFWASAVFLIFGLGTSTHAAKPSSGWPGIGVVVGDTTGPTIKYWFNSRQAFDVAMEFGDDVEIYGDYLFQFWAQPQQDLMGDVGAYLGIGAKFEEVDHDDNIFGIRTVGGVNYFFEKVPLELFLEAAPIIELSPDSDLTFDAGFGIRFYFVRLK